MLMTPLIQAHLTTRQLGREITYYPHTGSTNDDLWELLEDGEAVTGQMVVTDHQRAGKGRQGRSWDGAAGLAIAASVLLEPDWPGERLGLIPLAAGIATAGALTEFGAACGLKWPNDVLAHAGRADGRKIAGILAERRRGRVVIGIGINVNQQANDLPQGLAVEATSARLITGQALQRERLLAAVLNRLEPLLDGDPQAVVDQWLPLCVHRDQTVRFHGADGEIEGLFDGLDEAGRALLKTPDRTVAVASGDLEMKVS